MSRGPINLVPAQHRAVEISVGSIAVATLLVVAFWMAGWRWLVAYESGTRLRGELSRMASGDQLSHLGPSKTQAAALPSGQQLKSVKAAVHALNIPWRDLFEMVESATPATIDVIALDPDTATGQLALTVEAASPDDMLVYVRRLKRESLATSVRLVAHETVEGVGGAPRLRFRLTVAWHGAGSTP